MHTARPSAGRVHYSLSARPSPPVPALCSISAPFIHPWAYLGPQCGLLVVVLSLYYLCPMLFLPGPLISSAAGSIGGTTFQRGPAGLQARSKPLPRSRQSRAASTSRQRMGSLVQAWRSLSGDQRLRWSEFAANIPWFNRFGQPIPGSGYLAFLRCNLSSCVSPIAALLPPITTDAPTLTGSTLPAGLSVRIDPLTPSFTLSSLDSALSVDTVLSLFASAPLSPARVSRPSRVAFLLDLKPLSSFPFSIRAQYEAVYHRLPSAALQQQVFFRITARNHSSNWPGISAELNLTWV